MADLSPLAAGGVVANTAIATGGVPTGGDELVGLDSSGGVDWTVPYQDQDYITPQPISDASGNVYYVRYPGDRSPAQLVATRGTTVRWSKPLDSSADQGLAVGTNGQLYELDGNTLHGRDASDGHDLFSPLALNEFASGSYDRLFAYDQGLVIHSGYGKILYVDYAGKVTGGPYTYSIDPASAFERDIAASATGDLFIAWYDQALTSEGCLDANGDTHLAKYSPAGLAWTETLPHASRCNTSGPHVAATPNGGAVVSGSSDVNGATVQYADASGGGTWRRDITDVRGVLRPHVDENGEIFITTGFAFDCHLWSDVCTGVQVSRFGPDGAESNPIFLKGDPQVNQESWTSWSGGNLTLTPGNVVLALRHNAGGASFPTDTPRYSVDSFSVSGVGFEYPQSALWEIMRGSTTPTPTTDPSPTPTSPSPTPPSSGVVTYVAMGDSYSAGEGLYSDPDGSYVPDGGVGKANGPYYKGTDDPKLFNSCHRHPKAYGPRLTDDADLGRRLFVACSGALTKDLFEVNHDNPSEAAQLNQLKEVGANVKVVTLTIGGNDAGFGRALARCVEGLVGRDAGSWLPSWIPDWNHGWGCSKDKAFTTAVAKRISYLDGAKQPKLQVGPEVHPISEVLREIHERAPQATIYIAGYPEFFGSDLSPKADGSKRRVCFVGHLDGVPIVGRVRYSVDSADAKWINDQANELSKVINHQAKIAANAGVPVRYVSPSLFLGHGLCGGPKPWINPLILTQSRPGDVTSSYPDSASFHPTAEGQQKGYEQAFLRRMTQPK
jgi:lysophospholipase L1-like esterase